MPPPYWCMLIYMRAMSFVLGRNPKLGILGLESSYLCVGCNCGSLSLRSSIIDISLANSWACMVDLFNIVIVFIFFLFKYNKFIYRITIMNPLPIHFTYGFDLAIKVGMKFIQEGILRSQVFELNSA